jgi:predicted MPP superfamily phosphohydrolase
MGSDSAWKYTGSNLDKRNILHASFIFSSDSQCAFLTLYCAMNIALVSAVVKDNKEIMILTAYNVSQYKNAKVGEDTLFNQQIALNKLNKIRDPDPKKIFYTRTNTISDESKEGR